MSNRRIVVLAALALVSLTVASQAGAGQTQPPAAQSYWQNLKQQLTYLVCRAVDASGTRQPKQRL